MSNYITNHLLIILFFTVFFQSSCMEKPAAQLSKSGIEPQALSKKQRQKIFKNMPDLDKSKYLDQVPEYEDKDTFDLVSLSQIDKKIIERNRANPLFLAIDTKRENTYSEKRKATRIRNFFDLQIKKTKTSCYDSYDELSKLIWNHRSFFYLMIKEPAYNAFINNRIKVQDAYSLFNMAAVLCKAARAQEVKKISFCPVLAQKALDLIYQVEQIPHNDPAMAKDIRILIEKILHEYPKLYDYFQQLHGGKSAFPKTFGWLEESKQLQDYLEKSAPKKVQEPEAVGPSPVPTSEKLSTHTPVFQHDTPIANSNQISATTNEIPVVKTENPSAPETTRTSKVLDTSSTEKHEAQETAPIVQPTSKSKKKKKPQEEVTEQPKKTADSINIQELISLYRHAYIKGKYNEAAHKAWQVIKHTNPNSPEYKQAAERIDQLSKLEIPKMPEEQDCSYSPDGKYVFIHGSTRSQIPRKAFENNIKKLMQQKKEIEEMKPNILYYQIILHKDDTEQGPSITHFMEAQNARHGKLVEEPVEYDSTTFAALSNKFTNVTCSTHEDIQKAIAHISALADQGNQQAIQAIATYHHKAAMEIPSMQLVHLRMAYNYLNRLDPNSSAAKLNGFNPRQIYLDYFQQLYNFARLDKNAQTKGEVLWTKFYSLTRFIAESLEGLKKISTHQNTTDLIVDIKCSLKGNLHRIRSSADSLIEHYAPAVPAQLSRVLHTLLMNGANGLPLSIRQRQAVIKRLHAQNSQDAILQSLTSKIYEGSSYQEEATNENMPYSDDYYRMLFAIDTQDYRTALKLAQKLHITHNDFRAQMYCSNILLSTNIAPRTDDQKLVAIRKTLDDVMIPAKLITLLPVYSDAVHMAKEIAKRNNIPALELLIDAYCADDYHHVPGSQLMNLLTQLKEVLHTSTTPAALTTLTSKDFYTSLTYFCGNNQTFDPLWLYANCLLECVVKNKDAKAAEPAAQIIKQITEAIEEDIKAERKDSGFFVASDARSQLSERLKTIVSNKEIVDILQLNNAHTTALKLHWALNPHKKISIDSAEAQQMVDEVVNDMVSTFLDSNTPATDHLLDSDGNTENNSIALELIDVPKIAKTSTMKSENILTINRDTIEEYVNGSYYRRRNIITDLLKRKDFKLYKKEYGQDKPIARNREECFPQIQDFLLMAAHEYMIAQADSAKPLEVFDVPSAAALIQQALKIHPYYGCLEIANALIDNYIWPQNIEMGYRYLLKATELAEKHRDKLSIQDHVYLQSTRSQYASAIANLGFLTAVNFRLNALGSTKKGTP